jgi:hypothetical protein
VQGVQGVEAGRKGNAMNYHKTISKMLTLIVQEGGTDIR